MPTVRRVHVACAVLLVTASIALRDVGQVDIHLVGNTSAGDQRGKELRVFASTFNAGNEVYDKSSKFDQLMDLMVKGHEDEGQEADIIFLGFQEFRDNKYKMGKLVRETKAWTRLASSTMAAFKAEVGEATTAPTHVLAAKEGLMKALADFHKAVGTELAKLHVNDREEAKDSRSNLTMAATVKERLAPIHTWTEAALKRIEELKDRYPNLAYSDVGDNLWKTYESSVNNTRGLETLVLQSLETMSKELDVVYRRNGDLVGRLLQPSEFSVAHDHVEVGMHPQKFDSGWRCETGSHYDTFLYAFVNPFSKWKITAAPFSSGTCVERTGGSQVNPGCNIDNNVGKECGKVVNFLRFKAEQGGTTLTICGLNTHMSFSGDTAARMKYIEKAMQEADGAKCDAVFFLGDFNSRVHCEEGSKQSLPPFERMGQSGRSPLDYILDRFCTTELGQESCELKESNLDELNQMLNKDTLECYEKFTKSKPGSYFGTVDYWDIIPTRNQVKATGLREVKPPTWPPTYKLKRKDKVKKKAGVWMRCLEGEDVCFLNDDQKGKHNPAWTDRILMKSSSSAVHLEPTEYSRRPASFIASDHSPVTAAVTVRVSP